MQEIEQSVSEKLIKWYKLHKRNLPWRNTKDPYKIWLSEIILQQTRVDQGMNYYLKFVEHYPTVNELSNAKIDEVLRLWQGLGYYSRARNLHATACHIANDLQGKFPTTYDKIIELKGIGSYTAAAISSFAFSEKKAVLDGNVFRVLSRIFGIETDIASSKGKKEFQKLADELISPTFPGLHNQAIMEFGALHCTPANPNCIECPMNNICVAFETKKQKELPVKIKKLKVKNRFFNYVIFRNEEKIMMKKRSGKDIWMGLYDFYLFESEEKLLDDKSLITEISQQKFVIHKMKQYPKKYKHILSHQKIHASFTDIYITKEEFIDGNYTWLNMNEIAEVPKPVLINNFLKEVYF